MEIHTRRVGEVHVIDLNGRVTMGSPTIAIRQTISDLLANGGTKFVLNLGEVNYIDSSGLGELVRSFTTVTGEGKHLILLNLTRKIRELLVITKLLTVFQVYDSERAAVESFAGLQS